MGMICALLHYTPQQYWDLTPEERDAIVKALNKINGK